MLLNSISSLDYDTDAAIQKTLRSEFSKDTTLITIAHRLQTIIDYDKIVRSLLNVKYLSGGLILQ